MIGASLDFSDRDGLQGVYTDADAVAGREWKILLVGDYVNGSRVTNTMSHYYLESARRVGARVECFNDARISYNRATHAARAQEHFDALEAHISRYQPEIILCQGNYVPREGFDLSARTWAGLKHKHRFKLVVFISDMIPPNVNFADYWRDVCDLFLCGAGPNSYTMPLQEQGRLLDTFGWAPAEKPDWAAKAGLTLIGSGVRHRALALEGMRDLGIPIHTMLWGDANRDGLSVEEYLSLYRKGWYSFDLTKQEATRIITGRFNEAAANGCIFFETALKHWRTKYLMPWRHYIPVHTLGQVRQTILYFEKHTDQRRCFAEQAFAHFRRELDSRFIWMRMFEMLGDRA